MAGVTGIGSGIDISSIVKALVDAERAPKESQLDRLEQSTTSRISAIGTLRSVVGELSSTLQSLNKLSAFQKQTLVSSNTSILTASSSSTLTAGQFSLQVQQLASSSKVALQSVSGGTAATFGSGELTVSAGTSSITVDVTAANNSLSGIRDAINTAGQSKGISASIVTDASGSRLVLNSTKTGAGNDIQVSVTQDGVTAGSNALSSLAFSKGTGTAQLPALSAGAAATFKTGSLSIVSGAANLNVAVNDGDSLTTVRDAINTSGAGQGISARIETVSSGARLVIESSNSESLTITASDAGTGTLGDNSLTLLNPAADAGGRTVSEAKSALFSVDGLSVTKDSNTVSDVISGVTLNLVAAQSASDIADGKSITVSIGQDKGSVRANLQKFVDSYNKLVQSSSEMTAVVQVGEGKAPVTGPLLGDTSIRNLMSGLRKEMTQLGTDLDIRSLAQLGITTQKDGKLALDATKLDAALSSNYDKVADFLGGEGGLMSRMQKVVEPYSQSSGILDQRQKGLQSTLTSVDKQREALELRITKVQERLLAQYNAMDQLVGRLQKTSESLASQLASLPGLVKKDS
ncbi:flagellar hook-associated protein 2 [Pseudomonas fluvialis]|uniref:Flagellar hook-associated protein 2 n=1 Tax=Pseudomonas fluvialis TaxID=1793966 RepID=A0A7X0ETZ5_9PSED|nr:flagellar filament capping protein FliD [Pseudomonas fluvialis]MBB6341061.1 flagellar hook-associated protein 2 [Pseudomonas fluvialis]